MKSLLAVRAAYIAPIFAPIFVVLFALNATTLYAQSASSSSAADAVEINRLLKAGQADAAATKVEQALAAKPRDPQLRFLRGVIQIEQKRNNEAIQTFQRMTEDFPELPEPYNNLAVLYAGAGQFDKARAALELAIRTHPSYATAHENLGDIYAKLASESYSKALQLDNNNNGAQAKLTVIDNLTGKAVRPSLPAPVVAAAVAPNPPSLPDRTPPKVLAAAPIPVAAPPALPATKPQNLPTSLPASGSDDEVKTAVNAWAAAWSAKNVEGYLAAYGANFKPTDGGSRKVWAVERRDRIEGKKKISVQVEEMNVLIEGDKATVKFRQKYNADALATNSRKTLSLQKIGGTWLITQERVGG